MVPEWAAAVTATLLCQCFLFVAFIRTLRKIDLDFMDFISKSGYDNLVLSMFLLMVVTIVFLFLPLNVFATVGT